jgi:hypothetical protein
MLLLSSRRDRPGCAHRGPEAFRGAGTGTVELWLGGSMVEFRDFAAGAPASLLADPPDVTSREQRRPYDLSLAILHEENEHEACASAFLGHGPSGHNSRVGWPNSPDAGEFLTAGQQVPCSRSMREVRLRRRACGARWHGAAPRRSCGLPRPCV